MYRVSGLAISTRKGVHKYILSFTAQIEALSQRLVSKMVHGGPRREVCYFCQRAVAPEVRVWLETFSTKLLALFTEPPPTPCSRGFSLWALSRSSGVEPVTRCFSFSFGSCVPPHFSHSLDLSDWRDSQLAGSITKFIIPFWHLTVSHIQKLARMPSSYSVADLVCQPSACWWNISQNTKS